MAEIVGIVKYFLASLKIARYLFALVFTISIAIQMILNP